MAPSMIALGTAILACAGPVAAKKFSLVETYDKTNLVDKFFFWESDFTTGNVSDIDKNFGHVNYLSKSKAIDAGLVRVDNDGVYLGADHKNKSTMRYGRPSIKMQSNKAYKRGLMVARFSHLPEVKCGTWPAFWTTSATNWPHDGEFDIYEGWNLNPYNAPTLHTGRTSDKAVGQCLIDGSGASAQPTTFNCDDEYTNLGLPVPQYVHQGCTSQDKKGPWGSSDGGVFALEWTHDYVKIYNWHQKDAPRNIGDSNPDTASWGLPTVHVKNDKCNIDKHFGPQSIMINIDFCFDPPPFNSFWEMGGKGSCKAKTGQPTCKDYVNNFPQDFANAYFKVKDIRYFQEPQDIPKTTSTSSTKTSTTTTSTTSTSSKPTTTTTSTTSSSTSTTSTSTTPSSTSTSSTSTSSSTTSSSSSTTTSSTASSSSSSSSSVVTPTSTSTTESTSSSSTSSSSTSSSTSATPTVSSSTEISSTETSSTETSSEASSTVISSTETTSEPTSTETSSVGPISTETSSEVSSSETSTQTSSTVISPTETTSEPISTETSSVEPISTETSASETPTDISSGSATETATETGSEATSSTQTGTAGPISSVEMTTSTVYTTKTYTVSSCPPVVTNCPIGKVTTVTVPVSTTVCPVSEVTKTKTPEQPTGKPPGGGPETITTKVTKVYTITSCAPAVTDCPVGQVTTEVITTTYCPGEEGGKPTSPGQQPEGPGAETNVPTGPGNQSENPGVPTGPSQPQETMPAVPQPGNSGTWSTVNKPQPTGGCVGPSCPKPGNNQPGGENPNGCDGEHCPPVVNGGARFAVSALAMVGAVAVFAL